MGHVIEAYTDSGLSDILKGFINSFKDSRGNYKYLDQIDSNIFLNKITEFDFYDFPEKIQNIIKLEKIERVYKALRRAIFEVHQTKLGPDAINAKKENRIKFKILNYQEFENIVFEDEPIEFLKSITEIENPKYADKIIRTKAIVSSNTIAYNVPKIIKSRCIKMDTRHGCNRHELIKTELSKKEQVSFVDVQDEARNKKIIKILKNQYPNSCELYHDTETTTIDKVRVRPIMSSLYKQTKEFFDDRGNKWTSYDIFVEKNNLAIQAGIEIEITGLVIADPKNQKVTLMSDSLKLIDENKYKVEKIHELKSFFDGKSSPEILNWIAVNFENFSKIIRRGNVTTAGLLAFFSPLEVEFEGKRIPSWIKTVIIGDSTTGKSETIRQLIILLKAGQIISGEMASVAGLAGATVQSSGGQWFNDFGALVLQDRKLLAIDGSHKLRKDEKDKLAESERNGKIEITKASKSEAYSRTRQIKIENPLDEDERQTRTMDSFFYPVQSLQNNFQIQSIARIDLGCFVCDDIDSNQRNKPSNNKHDLRLEYLAELLRLVWSGEYKIEITPDALKTILEEADKLEKKFKLDDFPLITNDQKTKLAKLSASLACLTCSFDESLKQVKVLPEHVKAISKIISDEYSKAGLDQLVLSTKHDKTTLESLFYLVEELKEKGLDKETALTMLKWIAETAKFTQEQFQEQFDLSRDKQARPISSYLMNEKIIKRGRNWINPTKKGIDIGKFLVNFSGSSSSSGVKEDTPSKFNSNFWGVSILSELEQLETRIYHNYKCTGCNTSWKHFKSKADIEEKHNCSNKEIVKVSL